MTGGRDVSTPSQGGMVDLHVSPKGRHVLATYACTDDTNNERVLRTRVF